MRGNTDYRMVTILSCRAELRIINLWETTVTGTFLPSCAGGSWRWRKVVVQVRSLVTHRKPYLALHPEMRA